MSDQFCQKCGAFIPAEETSCPYCRQELPSTVSEIQKTASDIDLYAIRYKQNLFLWLMLVAFAWGGVNIWIASTALEIAREEMPEATFRNIRFNQIEIQSEKYRTLQTVLQTSASFSRIFQ
jgi:hypothetical protein